MRLFPDSEHSRILPESTIKAGLSRAVKENQIKKLSRSRDGFLFAPHMVVARPKPFFNRLMVSKNGSVNANVFNRNAK